MKPVRAFLRREDIEFFSASTAYGKTLKTAKVTPSLGTMQENLMQFGDPEFIYPAQIEVVVP